MEFSTVGFYTNAGNRQLPTSSLVFDFNMRKVRLRMLMKGLADEFVRRLQPDMKTGTKWSAVIATQVGESSLWTKELMGVTQTNWASLGSTTNQIFSKQCPKGKQDIVIEEIRKFRGRAAHSMRCMHIMSGKGVGMSCVIEVNRFFFFWKWASLAEAWSGLHIVFRPQLKRQRVN